MRVEPVVGMPLGGMREGSEVAADAPRRAERKMRGVAATARR